MKIHSLAHPRGIALVIVLSVLVLVLGICVGFLSRVSTERVSSSGNASITSARMFADTAVQVVQAQIDAVVTQASNNIAWSSQPGLIRTYDDSGAPLQSYKLYSSGSMVITGALVPATESASLAQWYDAPAFYTDLNAPVSVISTSGTTTIWPILDPSSYQTSGTNPPTPQGFAISGAPCGASQGVTNSAPMPVSWLYVLRDGSLVAPTGSGSTAMVAGASTSNPIVGRVAFWTDDETCKVNLNTASEGTFWDIPRASTQQERNLAQFQPAQNEFQSYPGHPATTSLSAVLTDTNTFTPQQIFSLVPRLEYGGSQMGTVVAGTSITLDTDRLFPNGSELLYSATSATESRAANTGISRSLLEQIKFFVTTSSRSPEVNLFNLPKIACWPISTINDSNHLTPFDRLIATCSTLNSLPFYFQRNPFDSSTPGCKSQTADYNIARNLVLYAYLQNLMARKVPGFGGNLATKFGDDKDQILTEIFDYIRCTNLYDENLPENTGQFTPGRKTSTYTGERLPGHGQVVPIVISGNTIATGTTRGFGRYPTITEVGVHFICSADAAEAVSNTNSNLTLINGTPLTSSTAAGTKQLRIEAALVMEHFCPSLGYGAIRPDIEIKVDGLQNWKVRGNAEAAGSEKSLGFPAKTDQTPTSAGLYIQRNDGQATVGSIWGGPMGILCSTNSHAIRARNGGRLPVDGDFSGSSMNDGVKDQQYPFISEPTTINITTANPQLTFVGGPLTIQIIDRASSTSGSDNVVQTLTVDFTGPDVLPAPGIVTSGTPAVVPSNADYHGSWTFQAGGCGFSGNSGRIGAKPYMFLKQSSTKICDVVRSMVPADSSGTSTLDYRLLAADPAPACFVKHPAYTTGTGLASSFMEGISGGTYHYPILQGKLAASASYTSSVSPDLPLPAPTANATGDWDNGPSFQGDGPYINKPDEGNAANINDSTKPPYFGNANPVLCTYNPTYSTPNRIMPSPVMFGSLPTGVKRGKSWQTLLFRRQPGHPDYNAGKVFFTNDPDYLLLDLFWMPIVQPYALSEPLSTAGKINMNQQIIPFTYITRNTGLYAVLKNERMTAFPVTDASGATPYKTTATPASTVNYLHSIKIPETLAQFQQRFDNTDGTNLYAFRSSVEICDMHIIPDNATVDTSSKTSLDTAMATYWATHSLTGDNTRERPYVTIYPRLTTKSNTYTVHFRAQALKQVPNSTVGTWVEGRDAVLADYRGAATIDRFLNPSETGLADYANNPDATPTLGSLYHWRTRSYLQFAP
ncbi:MAG: Verru_Chthon cassette protein A [Chthoniobacteraceae bacterium]